MNPPTYIVRRAPDGFYEVTQRGASVATACYPTLDRAVEYLKKVGFAVIHIIVDSRDEFLIATTSHELADELMT